MSRLHIDIETYSEEDLKETGVYRYAEHESTSLNCLGYAIDDGPVHQWIPFDDVPQAVLDAVQARHPTAVLIPGRLVPMALQEAWAECTKRAHNAQFERVVLNGTAGKRLGGFRTDIGEWTCTAVKVAEMGLPRSLEDAANALGTHKKSDGGRIEMLQLSKPRKPTKADPSARWTFQNAPDKWIAMLCYNIDDVLAERDLDNALPDIDENEQRLYHLDQKINENGWACDLEAVHNILHVVDEYKEQLAVECRRLTATPVFDKTVGDFVMVGLEPSQREKIADWVREHGVSHLQDMQAETINRLLRKGGVPLDAAAVLRIYSTYGAKSISKLQAMLNAVCADGRLRGMFIFYGAATGRWSSVIVQLQNILRPLIKDPNTAIAAFAERMLDMIRFLWPDVDPMKVAGSCVRGLLVAAEGHDLVYPDFSGIEDRVNAWFFDEKWVLDAYRAYDRKEGRSLYSITVCRWFGINLETFSDEDPRRQHGKVGRLSLNYEGGVNAFVTMADTYGVDLAALAKTVLPLLPEEALDHARWMAKNHPYSGGDDRVTPQVETACNGLKFLFRRDHPGVVQGWKNLKEAAEKAVEFEGQAFWIPNKKIGFKVETYKGRKWLCMRLPSGRKIRYFDPKWTPPKESERYINNELVPYTIPGYMDYMGIDTYTRQWMRLQTYGGKLDENADQGFSRDLLCNSLLSLDAAGYKIVGSEHDKAILEVPVGSGSVEEIKALMVRQPSYAAGLPLATDGKRVRRYGK